ncbi:MAG: hypothetical protein WC612_04365 [Bdellovibrionales bacterium]
MKRVFLTRVLVCAGFFALVCGMAAPAQAVDQADLMVALKTTPLLTNKLSGSAVMAVVFDPADAASKAEADSLKALLDAGIDAPGGVKITGMMVPVAEVGSKLSSAKLAFITKGACTAPVSTAANAAGVLSMSTDLDCVKGNKCILGIVTKPSVEIYYSKTAADAAKVGFAQAFTMLVKQI